MLFPGSTVVHPVRAITSCNNSLGRTRDFFSTHLSIRTNTAFLARVSSKLKHRSNGLKMQTNSWDTRKTINRIGMREANGLLELFLGQLGETFGPVLFTCNSEFLLERWLEENLHFSCGVQFTSERLWLCYFSANFTSSKTLQHFFLGWDALYMVLSPTTWRTFLLRTSSFIFLRSWKK